MNSAPGLFNLGSPNIVPTQTSVPNLEPAMEAMPMDVMGTFSSPTAWKPFMKRPRPAEAKVPADVKRRRKNYRAKKLLIPKNPLMILNELKPGIPFTISDSISDNNQIIFTATIEIDGISFSGHGPSKKQAQAEAAEAALRGIYFDKVLEQLLLKKDDEDSHMASPNQEDDCEVDGTLKSTFPEDDTPWSGLASLAMYKLVNAWQTPGPTNACRSQQPQVPSSQLKAKLPANASEIDPVMLLNQISPHSKFVEMSRDIRDCTAIFTLAVDFNGSSFSGSATKKKAAKKLCAKAALKSVGVEYND